MEDTTAANALQRPPMTKLSGSAYFGRPRSLRRRVSVVVFSITAVSGLVYVLGGNHPLSFSSQLLGNEHGITLPLGFTPSRSSLLRANPAAKHTYLPNGHLEVNPDGPHPILELIRDAEEKWRQKTEKASKTLDEAVIEYKRRYKRPPPKGFDLWWNYAIKNKVQLPDEYDFIYHDLEPFWGVSPEDLLKTQEEQEEIPDSFTLSRNETHPTALARYSFANPDNWQERALLRGLDEILALLKPIEDFLPPFRAVFSPHDNPNLLSNYETKQEYLNAARKGRYVDVDRLPKIPEDHYGFASACPPGSPARLKEEPVNQFIRPEPRPGKFFIHDHKRAMDPCMNPYIFYNHAQYVVHDLGPRPQKKLAIQFAYCSTPLYHDIQPPSFISWVEDVDRHNDPPWEEKLDERLMWRGRNTGTNHNEQTRWIYAQRIQLVRITNEMNGTENVLLPHVIDAETARLNEADLQQDALRVGEGEEIRKSMLNPAMMDISFTGDPIGCGEEYCRYLETLFEFRERQDPNSKQAGSHKYLVDVDGNGWSSRFKRLLTTNSLVFKATAYPEWWIDRIQPWVHYVPIQVDYSDLYDAYIFFRGGVYGEGNHDELARRIAIAGRKWSKTFWRSQDMTAYFFRLFLEYARLMSLDRDSMSFQA